MLVGLLGTWIGCDQVDSTDGEKSKGTVEDIDLIKPPPVENKEETNDEDIKNLGYFGSGNVHDAISSSDGSSSISGLFNTLQNANANPTAEGDATCESACEYIVVCFAKGFDLPPIEVHGAQIACTAECNASSQSQADINTAQNASCGELIDFFAIDSQSYDNFDKDEDFSQIENFYGSSTTCLHSCIASGSTDCIDCFSGDAVPLKMYECVEKCEVSVPESFAGACSTECETVVDCALDCTEEWCVEGCFQDGCDNICDGDFDCEVMCY